MAISVPLGDYTGLVSEISSVFVRFSGVPPSRGIANRSYASSPPRSEAYTIHFPSCDQVPPACRSSDWLICTGQPPLEFTFHRLNRPVKFEVKAISFPSGDHEPPPVARV